VRDGVTRDSCDVLSSAFSCRRRVPERPVDPARRASDDAGGCTGRHPTHHWHRVPVAARGPADGCVRVGWWRDALRRFPARFCGDGLSIGMMLMMMLALQAWTIGLSPAAAAAWYATRATSSCTAAAAGATGACRSATEWRSSRWVSGAV